MFEKWLCPNLECKVCDELKKGQNCPGCNEPAAEFNTTAAMVHISKKNGSYAKSERRRNRLLISSSTSDDDIQTGILEDIAILDASEKANSGWLGSGIRVFTDPKDRMIAAGFKMLVAQNMILIRQNELILRCLKASQTPPTNTTTAKGSGT